MSADYLMKLKSLLVAQGYAGAMRDGLALVKHIHVIENQPKRMEIALSFQQLAAIQAL